MTRTLRGVLGIAATLLSLVLTSGGGSATIPAGTKIVNQASATYQSVAGTGFVTTSNVVTVAVAEIASMTLGPQYPSCSAASDAVYPKTTFTRTFTATNTSNGTDAFKITSLTASAGTITSVAFVSGGASEATSADGTSSPPVPPGGSIGIAVTVSDAGVALGAKMIVSITVATTAKAAYGAASASAQQCGFVKSPADLSGDLGAGSPIVKTVDGTDAIQSSAGATVTYDIQFMNSGGSTATDVTLDDPVPSGVVPLATSVTIDGAPAHGATVRDNALTVPIGNVAIGAKVDVSFKATVATSVPSGTSLVNTATLTSSSTAPAKTLPATVFVGAGNVVYDGDVGRSAPISGALVSLLDAAGTAPMPLTGTAVALNAKQSNPMTTGTLGLYAFGVAAPKATTTYVVTVTAPGYVPRKLKLTLVPDASDTLYSATFTSLDGQPLAVPGGFTLEAGPSSILDVYGFFGNIPMFKAQRLLVTKVVDRNAASSGDRLMYVVTVASATTTFGATTVVDDLPPFVAYAPGTSRVDGARVEPVVSGSHLTWTFPALSSEQTISFAAVVLLNATDGTTLTNEVVANAAIPGSPKFFATGRAEAQTVVVPGLFSNRIPITGRVYLDLAGTGRFVRGDVGVAAVRVWLEDGESVTTDPQGRFDFPAARPGMHVLHVDAETLPPSAAFFPTRAYDDERSPVRLAHGPFDGGLLQDVNFALRPTGGHP
ncbi:MAG: isopeptide-forming domain-containing fimbrial protein [Candidatus Eremiobacteraeota bacterium]|nr:isopeptide-forming domain-containing fimbrial protein [Candidatus Eremiobacteraeota bacterium]